ncbi:hypothetical protein AhaeINNSZ174_11040 [Acinetobacter haemolyticus]|nr:hypothetical protein AhaeINNSZ174_11040 [Acinetobacter haemolyticus]
MPLSNSSNNYIFVEQKKLNLISGIMEQLRSIVSEYESDITKIDRKHPANTALPSDPISLNLVPT